MECAFGKLTLEISEFCFILANTNEKFCKFTYFSATKEIPSIYLSIFVRKQKLWRPHHVTKFENADRSTRVCVEGRRIGRAQDNELGFQYIY